MRPCELTRSVENYERGCRGRGREQQSFQRRPHRRRRKYGEPCTGSTAPVGALPHIPVVQSEKSFCTNRLKDNRFVWLPRSFARGGDALASWVLPRFRESRGRRVRGLVASRPGTGGGTGERHRRHRVNPLRGSSAGAAALTGDTAPPAAKRLPMAGSEIPAMDGPARQGRNQGAADGAVVVLRSDRRDPLPACL